MSRRGTPVQAQTRFSMVMRAVTSGSATRKDGSSSVTGVSQAMRPSSTIWAMSRVVMVLVVEPIIIRVSGVTGSPAGLRTPKPLA